MPVVRAPASIVQAKHRSGPSFGFFVMAVTSRRATFVTVVGSRRIDVVPVTQIANGAAIRLSS